MREIWERRAKLNMKTLVQALAFHEEGEDKRKILEGKRFIPARLKIRVSIPNNQDFFKTDELELAHIDKDGMSIYVVDTIASVDTLIHILVGDIMLIGLVNLDIERKILECIKQEGDYSQD